MADADAPSETRLEPIHLRFMEGGAQPAPRWEHAEPAYNHLYVVQIVDASPKNFRAYVVDVPVNGVKQGGLRWSHVAGADINGTVVNGGVVTDLDLVLNTEPGALVIFHLVDLDAVFEDPAKVGDAETVVLTDKSDMIFQAQWVDPGNPKAVSVILKGNPGPNPVTGRYGLRVKITIPSSNTISYVEIDPKVENQGDGSQIISR